MHGDFCSFMVVHSTSEGCQNGGNGMIVAEANEEGISIFYFYAYYNRLYISTKTLHRTSCIL